MSYSTSYFRIRYLKDEKDKLLLPLPFGMPFRKEDTAQRDGNGKIIWIRNPITHYTAQLDENGKIRWNRDFIKQDSCAQIYLSCNNTFSLKNDNTPLIVGPIFTFEEWKKCNEILETTHYLTLPPSGMYIAGKIDNEIVGTLVLSNFAFHMRPDERRKLEGINGDRYIEALWIRRIAVHQNFRKKGVGQSLAEAAISIAKDYWLPKPDIIELISKENNHQFLFKAGYEKRLEKRIRYLNLEQNNGTRKKQKEDTFYYWYKINKNLQSFPESNNK